MVWGSLSCGRCSLAITPRASGCGSCSARWQPSTLGCGCAIRPCCGTAGAPARLRRGEGEGWVLAGLLAVKLAYEHWLGALPFSGSDPVVVSAHLYGVIGGAAVAAFLKPQRTPL